MLRLERILDELSKGDPHNNFYGKYDVLKQRLLHHEYHFALANFPGGNDHGPSHIKRVLDYLDSLIPDTFLAQLNAYELFVLLMSTLYHDIGLLRGRPGHAKTGAELVGYDADSYLMNDDDVRYISAIVECHSGKADIVKSLARFREGEPVRGFSIRPRLLAALVRFADALDEDVRRADCLVEEKMNIPAESAIYWKASQKIRGVKADPGRETIEFNVKFYTDDITELCAYEGKMITVFEGVIRKLADINRERKYCMDFWKPPLSYKLMRVTFCQTDSELRPFEFTFDDWNGENEFFVKFPLNRVAGVCTPSLPGADIREAYLSKVAGDFKYVDFKGIPVPGGILKVSVADIFVEPSVEPIPRAKDVQARSEDMATLTRPYRGLRSAPLVGYGAGGKISSVLKKRKRLVILGDPGSGKTTVLRYVGFHCATGMGASLGLPDNPIPLYIGLREYAGALSGGVLPSLIDYIPLYFETHGMEPYSSFIISEVQQGRCLVMLDGLDEVPTRLLRRVVAEHADTFIKRYRGNRFLATSRIVGYADAPLSARLPHWRIQPFGQHEIAFFIRRWCEATESDDSVREAERNLLARAIFSNDRIATLAASPLLVTILARIHRTYRALPARKALLYSKCVEALLTTWDMNRDMPPVFVDERQANRIMGPVGLWIHDKQGGGFVTRRDLVSYLLEVAGGMLTNEEESSELVRLIEERSGLLMQRGLDRFTFTHLTFQEYYAARELVATAGYDDALTKHVNDPRWLEVLNLVAGLLDELGPAHVTPFLVKTMGLIKLPKKSIVRKERFGYFVPAERPVSTPCRLVARCVSDRLQPSPIFYDELRELLRQIAEHKLYLFELCPETLDLEPRWREHIAVPLKEMIRVAGPSVAECALICLQHIADTRDYRLRWYLYTVRQRPDLAAILAFDIAETIFALALRVEEKELYQDALQFLGTLPREKRESILQEFVHHPRHRLQTQPIPIDHGVAASLLDIDIEQVDRLAMQARLKTRRSRLHKHEPSRR
jgi:hypothetical protein